MHPRLVRFVAASSLRIGVRRSGIDSCPILRQPARDTCASCARFSWRSGVELMVSSIARSLSRFQLKLSPRMAVIGAAMLALGLFLTTLQLDVKRQFSPLYHGCRRDSECTSSLGNDSLHRIPAVHGDWLSIRDRPARRGNTSGSRGFAIFRDMGRYQRRSIDEPDPGVRCSARNRSKFGRVVRTDDFAVDIRLCG